MTKIKFINKFLLLFLLGSMTLVTSCEIEEIPNPNGSTLEDILNGASASELQTVVTGIEALMRDEIRFYYDVTAIIGREHYFFTGSDPRFTGELLGKEASELDPAGFYGTRPYAGRYATVKNANILIEAADNADPVLSNEEKDGYLGFAKTIQAYELLLVLNMQYQNGIRIDVIDPDNLGPFVSYGEALNSISLLLADAKVHLQGAGINFPFLLSSGFSDFDTVGDFLEFNRGLAARVALYQGDMTAARAALDESFMRIGDDFNKGPALFYSTAGGDLPNPMFRPTNQSDGLIAHPDFVSSLDADDTRASKIALRNVPLTLDGLTGDHDVVVFDNLNALVPIIRNEELILIYAEANIGVDNAETVNAINAIRTAHGLTNYAGDETDPDALLNEIVTQRRFSLFGEGHRWVDMRRLGRLSELPIDREGDDVWDQLPRPVSEQ